MKVENKCIIWGTSSYLEKKDERGCIKYNIYNLRAGGSYFISEFMHSIWLPLTPEEKIKLSGYIAQENLNKNTPDLDSILENQMSKVPKIPDEDERETLLLKGLVNYSSHIGQGILLPSIGFYTNNNPTTFLYALSYCSHSDEFNALLGSLEKSEDIEKVINYFDGSIAVKVNKKGRKRVKNKIKDNNSTIAFIAMWIHKDVEDLFLKIKDAVKKAGYEPLRIDEKPHNNKIDDEVLSEINKSRFVICDLTSEKEKPRGSVYFEAGYALGKDIPIIWTCREELKKEISFDIRQYNCLFWEKDKLEEFAQKLQHRIENVIGKGPLTGKNV